MEGNGGGEENRKAKKKRPARARHVEGGGANCARQQKSSPGSPFCADHHLGYTKARHKLAAQPHESFFGIVPFDSSRLLSFFMGWSACCPLLCVLNQRRHDYCSKAICSYVLGRRRLCAYVCVYCLPFRRLREKGPLPLSVARRFSPQRLFFVCSICIPCESQKKISPRPAIPRESKEMR